jgi:ubiquinone/menaquinone biosynthesis C-methylase UbiE
VRVVLIAGCGEEGQQWVQQGWSVVRLDIDPRTNPDIVGDMTNLGDVGPFDAIACNNALEHLYPHEVNKALGEFYRVLNKGGNVIICVPDLQDIKATEDLIPEIGMCGLHLMYGDAALIEEFPHMAHHSGFVEETLRRVMENAGFQVTTQRLPCHQLMGIGTK